MTDFTAWILSKAAKVLVKLAGLILLPWSIIVAIKNKRLNYYFYEVARGWDILANKLYAPALNSKLGPDFGRDETISQRMAKNKKSGKHTKTAIWWENVINKFDKDHLEKTHKKSNYDLN